MKRDIIIAAIIWIVLTAIGIVATLQVNIFPLAAAREAEISDSAFRFLMVLGTPVFAFVVAMLIYSLFRFRAHGEPEADGPPVYSSRPVTVGWFIVTTALSIFVIFNPGLKGLIELFGETDADLVVQVEGEQWHWQIAYPEYDLTIDRAVQMALPVDRRVKFEVTSLDVLHSFWVPAFRMKADAVPGLITELYITPTQTGSFEENSNLRLQCAELCGTGHARMQIDVLVLEQDEFDDWIAQAQELITESGH